MVYVLAVVVFGGLLLRHHYTIVTVPIPLDLYEGTMPLITGIIAQGHNPYTLAFQPQAADVYPPLYNILVAPLTRVFPNDLVLHRSVSAVFIAASCLLFGFVTWRRGRDLLHATAAAVAIYAGLVFYSTPVASTNALAVFLFSTSICIPWLACFSTRSLAVSAALGLLAFYAKQYCILGVAIVCLYVLLFVSVRRALVLGAGFVASLLLSLVIVDRTSPYFLDNTLFATTIAVSALSTWSIMLLQLLTFVRIYAGYLAIVGLLAVAGLRGAGPWARAGRTSISLESPGWSGERPLLRGQVDLFWFGLFWSSLAVMLTIGRQDHLLLLPGLPQDDRHHRQSCLPGSHQPALASYQCIVLSPWLLGDQQRLKNPMLLDRSSQFGQLIRVEMRARLAAVRRAA